MTVAVKHSPLYVVVGIIVLIMAVDTLSGVSLFAQVPNVSGQMAPPIPGVGHHYLGLQSDIITETVNPATGSVSVHLTLPTPPTRGINIPFSLIYNSSGVWQLQYDGSTNVDWLNRTSADNGVGWSYSFPLLTLSSDAAVATSDVQDGQQYQVYVCDFLANYVFQAVDGSRHELPLSPSDSASDNLQCNNTNGLPDENALSGGWDEYFASTSGIAPGPTYNLNPQSVTLDLTPPPVTVMGADGTVYTFNTFSLSNAPSYTPNSQGLISNSSIIEDRNGNIATIAYTPGAQVNAVLYPGSITYTDTSGRTAVSVAAVNPSTDTSSVTISGYSQPLTIQWEQVSSNFAGAGSNVYRQGGLPSGCGYPLPSFGTTTGQSTEPPFPTAIKSITLPNGQAFLFSYDSVTGLLQKITYPSGAYIEYTWGPNPLSEVIWGTAPVFPTGGDNGFQSVYCNQTYGIPAVVERQVSYDGATVALDQTFQYQTSWPNQPSDNVFVYGWNSKTTTVTTTDNIDPTTSSVVNYNYGPAQSDWQNLNFGISSIPDQTPVEGSVQTKNSSAQVLRTITESWVDPYAKLCSMTTLDDGSTSGTFYTYGPWEEVTDEKEFGYGQVASTACSSASGPGSTTPAIETKTAFNIIATLTNGGALYDAPSQVQAYGSGTLLSQTNISYDQNSLASANPPQHDSALGTTGIVRGNPTTITRICWPSCSNGPSTYTWDIAGQLTSYTDALGNMTCFSHQDNFVGGGGPTSCSATSSGSGTDSYLTMIDPPHVNGVSHATTYQYDSSSGNLRYATDPNGQTTQYQFEPSLNRLAAVIGPPDPANGLHPTTTIYYNDGGSNPTITTTVAQTPNPSKTSIDVMDGIGHVVQTQLTTDPNGAVYSNTIYDGGGRTYQQANPTRCSSSAGIFPASCSESTWGVTTFNYDALGRKTLQINPDDTSQHPSRKYWSYSGPITTSTDENGNSWQETSDAFGRLLTVVEPGSLTTNYEYDALNNLLWVHQSGTTGDVQRTRTFSYNSLSQLVCAANPENSTGTCPIAATGSYIAGTTGYLYYANGNVQSKTAPQPGASAGSGLTTTTNYFYDGLNRLTAKTYTSAPAGTPSACYTYDASSNGIGRLATEWTTNSNCTSSSGAQTMRLILAYDPMGRILNEQQFTPANHANGYAPAYTYDLAGNLYTSTSGVAPNPTPTSAQQAYAYSGAAPIQLTFAYDGAGRLQGASSNVTSNWTNGVALPGTLFALPIAQNTSCTSQSGQYSAFGGLLNASFGVRSTNIPAFTLNRNYDSRLRITCENDVGSSAAPSTSGSATVTITGAEQTN